MATADDSASTHGDPLYAGVATAPYLSVVVPTFNRVGLLARVIEALNDQQSGAHFEVVVIDDGSTDDTAESLQRYRAEARLRIPLRFATQPNAGPAAARNRGVALARGRYVVFIGDDTVPEPGFIAEHARVHRESGDAPLLACLGYTGWPSEPAVTAFMDFINDHGLQFGYKLIQHDALVPFCFFYTSNISLNRQLLVENPFDTTFPGAAWEDIELAVRLVAKGLKIRYNAFAVTRHHHVMTIDSFARRQYAVGKTGAIFYRKHPEFRQFLGIAELEGKWMAGDEEMRVLRELAVSGERSRQHAQPAVFGRLMHQHYLRGLRDGLSAAR